ncbi:MAG: hypothetical protein IPI75_02785 [Gammaproteobacteria bacterium]|nr:hypothetical protein [Gammaproteobacteria bacterium]
MYLDSDLDPNTLQDDYVKVNARIALAAADDRWEVALYGRNLTDETTYTFMVDAPLSAGIYAGWVEEPRVWGLQGNTTSESRSCGARNRLTGGFVPGAAFRGVHARLRRSCGTVSRRDTRSTTVFRHRILCACDFLGAGQPGCRCARRIP